MRVFSPLFRILIVAVAYPALSADDVLAGQSRTAASDSDFIQVQGNERLEWDQRASSPHELTELDFVAYVNGRPQALASVTCGTSEGPAGFECSATLPVLAPGLNVVEVSARVNVGTRAEGQRSQPIHLRFGDGVASVAGGVAARSLEAQAFDRSWTTADGAQLRATEIATGLQDSTDVLPLPDERLLIAERAGRVRVFSNGALIGSALELDDVMVGEGRGLLALTLSPDFSSTRHVFASYTTEDGLRVARFTLAGDRLVDRAVVLDGLPIAEMRPAAVLRAGPDGRLYLATDDGGDPERVYDLGSYSGKVLRFATDGTTPNDQAGRSPVWSLGVSHPVGLAWSAERGVLRLVGVELPESRVDRAPSGVEVAAGVNRLSLPPAFGATRATIGASSSVSAFRDQLFVGSANERAILKITFEGDAPSGSEWLLRDLPGPVTALAAASDGAIYAVVGPALLRIASDR